MENLHNPEELLPCPYDPVHRIRRAQMAFHINRCKKNFPSVNMIACDFNTTHVIPEPELQYHLENCPDRHKIERPIYGLRQAEAKFPLVTDSTGDEENWDDCHHKSYNPREYIEKSNVLQNIPVESRAKKRQFRMEQRNRLANVSQYEHYRRQAQTTSHHYINLPEHRNVRRPVTVDSNTSSIREMIRRGANRAFVPNDN